MSKVLAVVLAIFLGSILTAHGQPTATSLDPSPQNNPVKDLFGLISNLANGGPPIDFAKQVLNFGNKYVKDFDSTELPDALKWGISYLEGNSDMSGLTKKITDWLTSAIADLIFENNGRKKRDLSDSIENMVSSVIKIPFRIIAFILKLLGLPLRMLCSAGA